MIELGARAERGADLILDGSMVLLAAWTVSYHVCLVLRLGLGSALALAAVLTVLTALVLRRNRCWPDSSEPVAELGRWAASGQTRRSLAVLTVLGAITGALAMALTGPWSVVWLPWLLAAATGAVWSIGSADHSPADPAAQRSEPATTSTTAAAAWVLAWTVAMAMLSLLILKPNPDDAFYLNLSQWVADHGSFPLRDTLFADGVYPMTNWPPVASYDALVGAVARLTGAHAATISYEVVTPIASALSVLALWLLLRAWRVRWVSLALSVALVFLLTTGDASYAAPGNLFVTRLWQGKVILLCLVVPLLLVHALRYVERPSRAGLFRLAVVGTASVGLSTTAIFLTPALALAGLAPLALRSWRRAAAGYAALATYPLGAGVVTLALGGHSADDFGARRLYRFDAWWIGHEIFRSGPLAFVAVAAVLLGPLLLAHRPARLTAAVTALLTGLVLVPGIVRLSYDAIGLGPTLWRLSWGLGLAALVGVAASRAASLVATTRRRHDPSPRPTRWAAPAVGLVAVTLLVALGRLPCSSSSQTALSPSLHWQRPPDTRTMATEILRTAGPGALVLGPEPLSVTLAITSTDVWTVAPLTYYLAPLRDQPGFYARERRILAGFVDDVGRPRPSAVGRALEVLRIDVACVNAQDAGRYRTLLGFGFTPMARSLDYRCLQRP